ncbi:MAG: hypothetical protein ACKV2V_17720 [Blastocatellia bacterium]
MRNRVMFMPAVMIVVCLLSTALAQDTQQAPPPVTAESRASEPADFATSSLRNDDVVALVRLGETQEKILAQVRALRGDYDMTTDGVRLLRNELVPEAVIAEMLEATLNPQRRATVPAGVVLPARTIVEIESAHEVSSSHVKEGDVLSFRVVTPTMVGEGVAIPAGALATGKIIRARKGGHWGRPGEILWSIQDVVAADGQRIPLRAPETRKEDGDGTAGEVAVKTGIGLGVMAGAAALGIPIVGAIYAGSIIVRQGSKKGEHAIMPHGKRFTMLVQRDTMVTPVRLTQPKLRIP